MTAKRTQYGDSVGDDTFVNMDAYIDRLIFVDLRTLDTRKISSR